MGFSKIEDSQRTGSTGPFPINPHTRHTLLISLWEKLLPEPVRKLVAQISTLKLYSSSEGALIQPPTTTYNLHIGCGPHNILKIYTVTQWITGLNMQSISCMNAFFLLLLLKLSVATAGKALETAHPKCLAMEQYQASYVQMNYNVTKHMGFYYEMAFRDLYPGPPLCDCQHTFKSLDSNSTANYHEWFNFQCSPSKHVAPMIVQNLIDLNTTLQKPSAVYSQTITKSIGMNIPKFMESSFSTAVIAFEENKDDNDFQYEWVIEFTC